MEQVRKPRKGAQRPRHSTPGSDVSRGDKRIEDAASPNREGSPPKRRGASGSERPASLNVYDEEHYGTQALPPTLTQQVNGSEEEGGTMTAEELGREYLETEAQQPSKHQQTKRARTAATGEQTTDAELSGPESEDAELSEALDAATQSSEPLPADVDPHYASHTESVLRQVRER